MTSANQFKCRSTSLDKTKKIGAVLAGKLKRGDVVLLVADLGAGKTTFVQGVAERLGIDAGALSPTFILAQTLPARVPVHHLDFYRLSKQKILAAGLEDYLTGGGIIEKGIVFIEWADRCRELWPPDHLLVKIKIAAKNTDRTFSFESHGPRSTVLLKNLKKKLSFR